MLLLNSPHNPTGTVLSRDELDAVAAVAVEHDLVVVADEVYEHMAFDDDRPHVPIAALPGMRERTVSIGSAGKTFSFTGWKVGWVTGPPDLVEAVRLAKQFLTFVSGAPFQPAVAVGLGLPDAYFTGLRDGLAAKRDLLCDGLASVGFDVHRPQRHLLRDHRRRARSATTTAGRSAATLPTRAGVVADPARAVLGRHGDRCAAGAVGVLQARRGPRSRRSSGCGRPSRDDPDLARPAVAGRGRGLGERTAWPSTGSPSTARSSSRTPRPGRRCSGCPTHQGPFWFKASALRHGLRAPDVRRPRRGRARARPDARWPPTSTGPGRCSRTPGRRLRDRLETHPGGALRPVGGRRPATTPVCSAR